MKILHTSDWHVGKVLKGRDRYDEHVAVLRSIVQTARDEDVDVVLVAGDLFETAAPTAKAQGLVMRSLLALREGGRQVVVIAGNHDNQALLDAVYRPVLAELGLHVLGTPKRPDSGGLMTLRTRAGETINVAAASVMCRPPWIMSCRRACSRRPRTTPRSVTCTASRKSRGPAPSSTRAH